MDWRYPDVIDLCQQKGSRPFPSLFFSSLEGDISKFREEIGILRRHLGHAQSSYQSAEKRLDQFGQKLLGAVEDREKIPDQKRLL